MRLSISKSKNATSLYVIKSLIIDGKRTSKVVEKLGTLSDLEKKLSNKDPIEWAKKHIKELNKNEKDNNVEIIAKFSDPNKFQEILKFFSMVDTFFYKIFTTIWD